MKNNGPSRGGDCTGPPEPPVPVTSNMFQFREESDNAILAKPENHFSYTQVGDACIINFGGHYNWVDQERFFREACNACDQSGAHWLIQISHWYVPGLEAEWQMAAPNVWSRLRGVNGCTRFYDKQAAYYWTGHTHITSKQWKDGTVAGFVVGDNGMGGGARNNKAMVVWDTSDGRFRVYKFNVRNDWEYSKLRECLERHQQTEQGWRGCLSDDQVSVEMWHDQAKI